MGFQGVGGHHDPLRVLVILFFRDLLPRSRLHDALGVGDAGTHPQEDGGVVFLRQPEGPFREFQGLLGIRGLQHGDLGGDGVVPGVLLVLGGEHPRVVGHADHQPGLPALIGNVFQQIYNIADSVIVGRYVGADALAAVGHAEVWLSLKPAGYGELLPRKRMGILHRAEYASVASRADRLETPLLKANAIKMEVCEIGGAFTVTNSFVSGGGSISNIVDGTTSTSVGAPGGTVLVTETFDCWRTVTGIFGAVATPITRNDVMCVYKTNSGYGAFSLPVQEGLSISGLPNHVVYMFMIQNIGNTDVNPLN